MIQLRAQEIVYKTALDISDETNKELIKKVAKLKKQNNIKGLAIGAIMIFAGTCVAKKYKQKQYDKLKSCPDFDDFEDDEFVETV